MQGTDTLEVEIELAMTGSDHLFGIVVSTSDCHPRGPGFDSRLYPRNFWKNRVWNGVHPAS